MSHCLIGKRGWDLNEKHRQFVFSNLRKTRIIKQVSGCDVRAGKTENLTPGSRVPLLIDSVVLVNQKLGLQQRVRVGGSVIGMR